MLGAGHQPTSRVRAHRTALPSTHDSYSGSKVKESCRFIVVERRPTLRSIHYSGGEQTIPVTLETSTGYHQKSCCSLLQRELPRFHQITTGLGNGGANRFQDVKPLAPGVVPTRLRPSSETSFSLSRCARNNDARASVRTLPLNAFRFEVRLSPLPSTFPTCQTSQRL